MPIPYLSPQTILEYMLREHPEILVGGLESAYDRARHLEAFWEAFRQHDPDHEVFREHGGNLQTVLPFLTHGDDGRGKRRAKTTVLND